MDIKKIDYINELIDNLKVIDYSEKDIPSDTSFLKLKVGDYQLNNGENINRESVVRQVGSADAVAMFSITKDKKIILVIQPRVALPTDNKVDIEIPAGYIELNETILEASVRELKEETGYVPAKVINIDEYYPSLGYSGEKIYIVLALGCEKREKQHLDRDEFINYIEVTIDEFKYLLDNGYILDATARLAYYRTLEYLDNNSMIDIVGR